VISRGCTIYFLKWLIKIIAIRCFKFFYVYILQAVLHMFIILFIRRKILYRACVISCVCNTQSPAVFHHNEWKIEILRFELFFFLHFSLLCTDARDLSFSCKIFSTRNSHNDRRRACAPTLRSRLARPCQGWEPYLSFRVFDPTGKTHWHSDGFASVARDPLKALFTIDFSYWL